MPGRLTPLPISLRAPSSPEAMSLTETSRPAPEFHLLHPSFPCMPDGASTRDLHHISFGTIQTPVPQMVQSSEAEYCTLRREPGHILAFSGRSRLDSPISSSRTMPSSNPTPLASPDGSMPFEQHERTASLRSLELGLSPSGPPLDRERSEENSGHDISVSDLRSLTDLQRRSVTSLTGRPEVRASRSSSRRRSPRGDISRRMGISSLISSDNLSLVYDLIIRQQPIAARACGFGDRDRRVIDPPPILEMVIRDPRVTAADLDIKTRHYFSVVYCELWNSEQDHEETTMPEVGDRPHGRRMMGSLVASPIFGRDEFGKEGCFFAFPDLSCRTTGKYRLRFALVVLDPANMKLGEKLPFRATVMSDIFEVYPAKTFPGMVQSTALAKCLKEQGCLISVKKGHQRRGVSAGPSRSVDQEEDNDEDDEGDSSENGRRKRQKT